MTERQSKKSKGNDQAQPLNRKLGHGQEDNVLLINREGGHYREISDRGLDVLTER